MLTDRALPGAVAMGTDRRTRMIGIDGELR